MSKRLKSKDINSIHTGKISLLNVFIPSVNITISYEIIMILPMSHSDKFFVIQYGIFTFVTYINF